MPQPIMLWGRRWKNMLSINLKNCFLFETFQRLWLVITVLILLFSYIFRITLDGCMWPGTADCHPRFKSWAPNPRIEKKHEKNNSIEGAILKTQLDINRGKNSHTWSWLRILKHQILVMVLTFEMYYLLKNRIWMRETPINYSTWKLTSKYKLFFGRKSISYFIC